MKGICFLFLCVISLSAKAQSPGQIVRPAGGNGVTLLNPNGDGFSSITSGGITSNDISESEIPYKVVPVAITEPTGDVATGPSGGFTDIVKTVDGSGFYIYSDGTNIFFRLRIGSIISGSKGYSALIDTDGKIGNSGPNADPNYVAPTNTSNGNPGFEYEIVLQTNFQVAVYNVDGNSNPGSPIATYALTTNSQISTALSTDGNNRDYFYDWYAPLSAIGSPVSFRVAATTVTSPSSALQGSRSDIYGIDDARASVSSAWTTVANAQPVITVASIGNAGAGVGAVITAAPIVNGPINTGINISVGGSWTAMDVSKPSPATITLYKNNIAVGTATVTTGSTWSITVPTAAAGDIFYAKAVATGETTSLQSNNITAGCISVPAAPTITCASSKGITGLIPLGTTVNIYQVTTTNASPTFTPLSTGLVYTNNTTDQTFNYYGGNSQTGNACQGQNSILTTNNTYMVVSTNGGCSSVPTFICITGASQNAWNYITANTLTVATPIYPFNSSITGTGAASGQLLRLFINNQYNSSLSATGSSFTFSNLSVKAGDTLRIYAQTSGACMTVSNAFIVSGYTPPPVITTNSAGNLLTSATIISGTSSIPGASVTLYRGVSPSGTLVGTATVNSSGMWVVSGLTLATNETYYATQTSGGYASPSSQTATVLAPTTAVPVFSSTTYPDVSASIGGTIASFSGTVRVYLDGTLIGATVLTNATTWSIQANTTYSNSLYPGGALTVTAQTAAGAESAVSSSTATVNCTSPVQPTITPVAATINTGQAVTFSVSNAASNTWYAVTDNTGISYATSAYTSSTNNFTLPTQTFTTAGTYNLNVTADKLTGCPLSYSSATITVTGSNLPVLFSTITAMPVNNRVKVTWTVSNEQNISFYLVEKSQDCQHYEPAGKVTFHLGAAAFNQYAFTDSSLISAGRICYRIKQVDKDGNYTYSSVVSINSNPKNYITVSPNPTKEKINISFTSLKEQSATVELIDINGKVIHTEFFQLYQGANVMSVQGLQAFSYKSVVVRVIVGKEIYNKKVIIQ